MFDLPERIKLLIGDEPFSIDNVGMSDSTVILFQDKILKIQTINEESEQEYRIMEWLQNKLSVPKVLGYDRDDRKNYLLMSKVQGEMACADHYLKNPEHLTTILAEGLRMLWKVEINNCPFDSTLNKKLQMAKFNIEHNLVDLENVEQGTFSKDGFKNPAHLLKWLYNNKPEEELVLSHGDFCLPNIFISEGRVTGYIDLGKTGIADKWQDIALCYRSLLHNFDGKYTGIQNHGFTAELLFEKLGIEPNWDKIRYYILLDELF
jgi:aminoglycoside phosphotransferase